MHCLIYREQWNKIIFPLFLLLGIILPFLFATYIDSYHWSDVNVFHYWADCWGQKNVSILQA